MKLYIVRDAILKKRTTKAERLEAVAALGQLTARLAEAERVLREIASALNEPARTEWDAGYQAASQTARAYFISQEDSV